MKEEYVQRIDGLLSDYARNAKPLIDDIISRHKRKNVPDNILNEIRAFNDHIARCYREAADDGFIEAELRKAEGHIRRLLYDCFKQLNIYIRDKIKHVEFWRYSNRWLLHQRGDFWKSYTTFKRVAQLSVIEAKKRESMNPDYALKCYETAYRNYRGIEELFKDNRGFLFWSAIYGIASKAFRGFGWLLTTIILTIIATLIGLIIS